ncbi:potassium transporter Kup [Microlunatus endophyticus]|uniref:potassium transporter Kup n=1 Tax=Microlunatus endophyticus TaxID=1716077 RepID=UPI0016673E94|nr:KUP/HAK/KT family potassium transporter [Microlunatus endophyticus]
MSQEVRSQVSAGHNGTDRLRLAAVVGALGVVFGDIGTSPIYTLQTLFSPDDPHPIAASEFNVLGVVSLILWSVTLIVTVSYVMLALRISNDGEGGIMALLGLMRQRARKNRTKVTVFLAGLGILGASLFLGDGMITPAISVLSAVEGMEIVRPSFKELVIPVTVVIIAVLFLVQRFGTGTMGKFFGPVMILWFTVVGVGGISGIVRSPSILRAISPTYAVEFVAEHPPAAFFALAAVILAITGAEALYADMGHFGRRPIAAGWLVLVFPALALTYMGQGGLLLNDPHNTSLLFFQLVPVWARIPTVVLATAATVIASEAVITGAYSVTSQAVQLGYLPRLRIVHTSAETRGQIYVPFMNWLLMVAVLTLVLAFRSSASLAFAYGMTAAGTITVTTILFFYIAYHTWRAPRWVLVGGGVILILVDLSFVAANMTKLLHGAWLPLAIALVSFTIMITWQKGRGLVTAQREQLEGELAPFVKKLSGPNAECQIVEGTAIFLNPGKNTTPLALRANVERNHIRHRHVVIASVNVLPVPRLTDLSKRAVVDRLSHGNDGIIHVSLRFGYDETPDVPAAMATLKPSQTEGRLDLENAIYFLSKIELHAGKDKTMAAWRKQLFLATSHITADASDHFGLPRDQVVMLGANVDV